MIFIANDLIKNKPVVAFPRAAQKYRASKKTSLPVSSLLNRGPLMVINDSTLILN